MKKKLEKITKEELAYESVVQGFAQQPIKYWEKEEDVKENSYNK